VSLSDSLRGLLRSAVVTLPAAVAVIGVLTEPVDVQAQSDSETELAKQVQNPVADLISIPFQSNFNFTVGPDDDLQYILNIQPVVPFRLTQDWNLITRTIIPLIDQPVRARTPAGTIGDVFGIGDIQLSLFLSPARGGSVIWGAGPILQLPTASDPSLGADKWAAGPTGVLLTIQGPWVLGGLVNHLWSLQSDDRPDVNRTLLQPFLNYNLPGGWYLTTSPIITADWEADDSDDRWTVPIGGGVGKIQWFGPLPVNLQLAAFYNVVRPDEAPEWNVRLQIQFLFPRSR
jgi:hypothetical protein